MNKQDWYLKELGITQYVLRDTSVIKGESPINIAETVKLVIVKTSSPHQQFLKNVLKALNLSNEEYLIISPDQFILPIEQFNRVIWFINQDVPEKWALADSDKAMILTSDLQDIAQSSSLKRQLWRMFCQYENHFNIN